MHIPGGSKLSLNQSKIEEFLPINEKKLSRRKRVLSLKLEGYKNQEISIILGWSLSTIEKDLQKLRKISLRRKIQGAIVY